MRELEALNASWKPLGQLTPAQFNSYRSALGEGSGFQSAMYRRMEFLLGDKSASMLVPHRGAPRVHAELEKALHEPSLYDEVVRLLARRGYDIPEAVLRRDVSKRYEPSPEVEAAWTAVYSGDESDETRPPRRGVERRRRAGVALAQRPPGRHPPRDGFQDRHGRLRRGGLAGEARAEERVPRAVDGAVLCLISR